MTQQDLEDMYSDFQYQDILRFYDEESDSETEPSEYCLSYEFNDEWFSLLGDFGCGVFGTQEQWDSTISWIEFVKSHGFTVLENPFTLWCDQVTYVVIPPTTVSSLLKHLGTPKDLSWLTVSTLETAIKGIASTDGDATFLIEWIADQAGLSQEVQERLKGLAQEFEPSNCNAIGSRQAGEPCTGNTNDEPRQVTDSEKALS